MFGNGALEMNKVPLLDLKPELNRLMPELTEAALRVIASGEYIGGKEVKAFEDAVAAYLGLPYVVPLNSGTDALMIALDAAGVKAGDEVITSPCSFFATAEAISRVGAQPVFADIDPLTFTIDVHDVRQKLTPRTKAIIPVHLFGHAADMDELTKLAQEHNLFLLEDVAQAFGGRHQNRMLGSIGHAAAFSFFPSKTLGGFGDGGLFATKDKKLADDVRMLAVHGARKKYHNERIGYNSRLDALQAALLGVKLKVIDELIAGRRRVAQRYDHLLAPLRQVKTPYVHPDTFHAYHQYTIVIEDVDRSTVQQRMLERGIETFVYYPTPLHKLPVYEGLYEALPHAERTCARVLSLPISPFLEEHVQDRVVTCLEESLLS
jgi:dTDP-4-amino-4,6-dideoxygalactose transaminase